VFSAFGFMSKETWAKLCASVAVKETPSFFETCKHTPVIASRIVSLETQKLVLLMAMLKQLDDISNRFSISETSFTGKSFTSSRLILNFPVLVFRFNKLDFPS